MQEWKSREWKLWHQKAEGGKRGRNEHGKPKFPLSNTRCRVEHWISLPKWVTTANRTNVVQNDVTHLYIYCAECFLPLNTHLNAQCVAC